MCAICLELNVYARWCGLLQLQAVRAAVRSTAGAGERGPLKPDHAASRRWDVMSVRAGESSATSVTTRS